MQTFLSDDPWRAELKEITELDQDHDESLRLGWVTMRPSNPHFEFRVWYEGRLVFFMTTDPRCEVDDIPEVSGSVHMFNALVEGDFPLRRLLEDANRVRNKGD